MKYKFGIFGSAAGNLESVLPKSLEFARELAKHKDEIIILTGAGPGLPFVIAKEAAALGVEVWGFSPAKDLKRQKQSTPDVDPAIFKKIIYLSADLPFTDNVRVGRKYRNVTSTASCDAGIVVSGRWGSMNEFTNLMDMQKIVGVLTGTGGWPMNCPLFIKRSPKKAKAQLFLAMTLNNL